jgi:ribosome-binding ATPase YchF (GTP1/OBG family)
VSGFRPLRRQVADRLRGFEGVVDFALHFKAVFALNDLITLGSQGKTREAGKLHIEGKEYVVQDGDVIEFRFNV